jgi:hypothetical protein
VRTASTSSPPCSKPTYPARPLDGLRDGVHGLVLPEHDPAQRLFEGPQPFTIGRRRLLVGDAGRTRGDALDVADVDDRGLGRRGGSRPARAHGGRLCRHGLDARHGAGLVDQVDGAVGQPVVAKMPRGELRRRLEGSIRVTNRMVLFVPAPQPREDLHGIGDRRLFDGDLLQPSGQRTVLLDLLELLERRRTHDAKLAGGQNRLEHRCQIHRAARNRAGPDRGVHFVDEENRLRQRAQGVDDSLEAFFEVPAETSPREQGAGVEGEHLGVLQRSLHVVMQEP